MQKKRLTWLFRTTGLFVFWVLLSGKMDAFHLGMGLASAAVISSITLPIDVELDTLRPAAMPGIIMRGIFYSFWLMGRIFLAAAHVSRLILDRKMPIDPQIIHHPTNLKLEVEKVIFANSITLTPGTITADIKDGKFTVHCLDKASAADIVSNTLENQIQRVLGKELKR